jgi:hypothetical protein
LCGAFTEARAIVFLPKLARLVADGENRRALLKAPKLASILKHNSHLEAETSGGGGGQPRFVLGTADDLRGPPPILPPPAPEDNPFSGAAAGAAATSVAAASPQEYADSKTVQEMFPDLPLPAILAALQKDAVGGVIEKALAGGIDKTAIPVPLSDEQRRIPSSILGPAVCLLPCPVSARSFRSALVSRFLQWPETSLLSFAHGHPSTVTLTLDPGS